MGKGGCGCWLAAWAWGCALQGCAGKRGKGGGLWHRRASCSAVLHVGHVSCQHVSCQHVHRRVTVLRSSYPGLMISHEAGGSEQHALWRLLVACWDAPAQARGQSVKECSHAKSQGSCGNRFRST
jgi:hypothetical protein